MLGIFKSIGAAIAKEWGRSMVAKAIMVFQGATLAIGIKGYFQARDLLAKGQDILANKTAAGGKIPVIYGRRRVGAQIVYMDTASNRSKDLFIVYALSVGECEEIEGRTIELDGNPITDPNRFRDGWYIGSDKINSGAGSLNTASQVGTNNGTASAGDGGTDPTKRYRAVFNLHHGAATQTADPMLRASIGSQWTTAHKLNGITFIAASYEYDTKAMFKSVPQLTVVVKGQKVYDPRLDSTVTGGSGNQDLSDPSTYAWNDNAACCFLNYLTNDQYGKGLTASDLDLESFRVAAALTDTLVDTPDFNGSYASTTWSASGASTPTNVITFANESQWSKYKLGDTLSLKDSSGNLVVNEKTISDIQRNVFYGQSQQNIIIIDDEIDDDYDDEIGTSLVKSKRFHCNGLIDTNKNVMENAKELLGNMRGILNYVDGKYELLIEDTGSSEFTVTDDHIIDGISIDYGNKDNRANKVVVEFYNGAQGYEQDTATIYHNNSTSTYKDDDGGEELEVKVSAPLAVSPYVAWNMGKAVLARSRYQTSINFMATPELYKVNVGSIITVDYAGLGLTNPTKDFRIETMDLQANGLIAISAIEYIDIYTWQVPPVESVPPASDIPTGFELVVPTGLVLTDTSANNPRAYLSWTANLNYPVDSYRVIVLDSDSNSVINAIVNSNYIYLDLLPIGTYNATVTAINSVGTESEPSTPVYPFTIAEEPIATDDVQDDAITNAKVHDLSAVKINTGELNLGTASGMAVKQAKSGYTDTTTGFWLGNDGGTPKFNIGTSSNHFKFDGTGVSIKGALEATALTIDGNATITGTLDASHITVDGDALDTLLGVAGTGANKVLSLGYDAKNKLEVTGTHLKYTTYDQVQANGDLALDMFETSATFYPSASRIGWIPTVINAGGQVTTRNLELNSQTTPTYSTSNLLYNVGGALYWNGNAVGTGNSFITSIVAGTNLNGGGSTGTVTLNLDSTITGNHTFSNNVIIGGDLTVQGTTVTVDTTNLDVKDKNITINYSTGDSSATANGAGITIQDAVSAGNDATLTWNTANDTFNFSHALDVTGTATMDGLTVDGTATATSFNGFLESGVTATPTNSSAATIYTASGSHPDYASTDLIIQARSSAARSIYMLTGTTTPVNRFKVDGGGDISFYEDTGTTAKFFWDSSAESLGIGTTSPSSTASLHLKGAGGTELHMESGDGASTSIIKHNQSANSLEFTPNSGAGKILDILSTGIDVTGNIVVSGTVDGRDIATDGTKLDGIEAGATTDQTQAEINALGITAIGLSGTPNISVGTINSGSITITTTAVPLKFVESGHTGNGQYWRIPLDGGNLRFDVSTGGGASFTSYDNVLQLNSDGSINIQGAQMFDTTGSINTTRTINSSTIVSTGSVTVFTNVLTSTNSLKLDSGQSSISLFNTGTYDAIYDAGTHFFRNASGAERLRIDSIGRIGLSGANYGSSGQVLTSNGNSHAPSWQDSSGVVTTYTNGANNRIVTSTGTAGINGEGNLTFDGSTLAVTGAITSSGNATVDSLSIYSGGFRSDTIEGKKFIYFLTGQGTDTNFKKVADVTIGTGLYKALAARVVIESQGGNFGNTVAVNKTEYVCVFYRSAGVQDDQNNATISGKNPTNHNLRIVKTATGVYELQIKQTASYKDAIVHIEILSTNGGAITIPSSITNGATSGTVTIPTASITAATITANRFDSNFFNTDNFSAGTIATTGTGNITSQQFLTVSTDGTNTMSMFHSSNNFVMKRLDNDGQIQFMNNDTSTPFVFDMTTASPVFTTTGTINSGAITTSGTLTVDAGSSGMIDFGDVTSAYGRLYADSTGTYIGSKSNHNLILRSNHTAALTLDTSQNATFAGTLDTSGKITITNSAYNNHLRFVRSGQGDLNLSPSANQLLLDGGGFSPASNNAFDLGRTDKYWQDLWLGSTLKMGGTTVLDSSRQLQNINGLGATTTNTATGSGVGFKFVATDTVVDQAFNGFTIDHNVSGSDTATADRVHSALLIDQDSSATGGDTSNEHRLYGINASSKATGDSDLIRAGNFLGIADHDSGQISSVYGINAIGRASGEATTVNVYGAYGYAQKQNGGNTTAMYGSFSHALIASTNTGAVTTATGSYGEVQIDSNTTLTTAHGVRSIIDRNNGTIGTGYLFRGNYQGTLPTTAWGVYIDTDVPNYFGGSITSSGDITLSGGHDIHLVKTHSNNGVDMVYGQITFGDTTAGQYVNHARIESGGAYANNTDLRFHTSSNNNSPVRFQMTNIGEFKVGTTTILDQSRNLTNIGSISSGQVTITQTHPTVFLQESGGGTTNAAYLQKFGNDLYLYNKEANGSLFLGTNNGTKLTINNAGTATFAGTINSDYITADHGISATGIWINNNQPATNDAVYSGYGAIGNRATFYITNGGGVVEIGNGSVHSQNASARFSTSVVNLGASRSLQMNGTTVIDASRNLTNIGTIGSGAITATGIVRSANYFQVDSSSDLLRINISAWSGNAVQSVLKNGFNTTVKDHLIVKASGNAANNHGAILISDEIFAYGKTESLPTVAGSLTAPFTTNSFQVTSSGNATFAGTINSGAITSTGNSLLTGSGSSGSAFLVKRGSDGANALAVQNTGDVLIQASYLYVVSTAGSYFQHVARFRGGIQNDVGGAPLLISDNLNVDGIIQISGTTVIDASRNLTNIGNIDATQIKTGTNRVAINNGSTFSADGLSIGTANSNCEIDMNHTSGKRFRINNLATGLLQFENKTDGNTMMSISSVGNGIFTGDVQAYSDERLKDNIQTLDGKKALQMRGVSFTRDGRPSSGVIAQEVEKIAPELVMTADDEMGTKSVAYGNLVGYLIETVKDQQAQIDELKAMIEKVT